MRSGFVREDAPVALLVVAAHAALFAALSLFGKVAPPPPVPPRMQVTISSEVAPTSTAPEPAAMAASDIAPTKGEPAPAPLPQVQPMPRPEQVIEPAPEPLPVPVLVPKVAKPAPVPVKRAVHPPKPAPVAKAVAPAKPAPVVKPAPRAKPAHQPAAHFATPGDERPRRRPDMPAGASVTDRDYLKGISESDSKGIAKTPSAAAVSERARAASRQTIGAKVLPLWDRCVVDGADIEKLSVRIVIHMDRGGRVQSMSAPEIIGKTPSNQPQVDRFIECAQNSIQGASPFALSEDAYAYWKDYTVRLRKKRGN